jgi:hemoglobin
MGSPRPTPDPAIDEAALEALISRFYSRAREDGLLGPVFAAVIEDWEPHLAAITQFWCATMLGSRRYVGDAFAAHARHALTPAMFDRWLEIWSETVHSMFETEIAALLVSRADRIGHSLRARLFA